MRDERRTVEAVNHDEVPLEYYLKEYAKEEPTHIANRLGIPFDYLGEQFNIQFLGDEYYVSYPGLVIERVDGEDTYGITKNVNFRIIVARYLLYSTVFPQNGEFMAFGQLPSGDVFVRQFNELCVKRLNKTYGNNRLRLQHVMEAVNAMPVHQADEAYELEFMEGLSIRFLFWDGDDEFESSAQILFSSNFPAAFGTYDLSEIVAVCLDIFDHIEVSGI